MSVMIGENAAADVCDAVFSSFNITGTPVCSGTTGNNDVVNTIDSIGDQRVSTDLKFCSITRQSLSDNAAAGSYKFVPNLFLTMN